MLFKDKDFLGVSMFFLDKSGVKGIIEVWMLVVEDNLKNGNIKLYLFNLFFKSLIGGFIFVYVFIFILRGKRC